MVLGLRPASYLLLSFWMVACGGSGGGGAGAGAAGGAGGSSGGAGGSSGGAGGSSAGGSGGVVSGGGSAGGGAGGSGGSAASGGLAGAAGAGCAAGGGGSGGSGGCGAGLTLCGSTCVNLQTSSDHCGACGSACPAGGPTGWNGTGSCVAGQCKFSCYGGFANCNGDVKDGCEVSLSDSNHCGTCGRVCDSGCNNATCQWTKVTSGVSSPGAIALDATNVYFAAGTSIYQLAKSGGTPTSIATITNTASSGPGEIVVDGGRVYFTDLGTSMVRSVAVGGGSEKTHAVAEKFKLVGLAVSTTQLFWTTGFGGSVESVPLAGGAKVTLASGQAFPSSVVHAGGFVYWTDTASPGGLWKHGLAPGGNAEKLGADPHPGQLVVWGGTAYYAAFGEIRKLPLAGGTATGLASASSVWDVATDGSNVYWIVESSTAAAGAIRRVPVGGGPVFAISNYLKSPTRIAVDQSHVYWTDIEQNDVKRVSK